VVRPRRTDRVRKRAEYVVIQSHGRRVSTPHFALALWSASEAHPMARLGITASRKIGGAVVRNRAKRLVREAFRRSGDLWSPDIDVVVIVRRALGPMKLADVLDEWNRARPQVERRSAQAREDRMRREAREAQP
jgi:ribonuclease P protein component